VGISHLNQTGAFGKFRKTSFEDKGSHFIGLAAISSHGGKFTGLGKFKRPGHYAWALRSRLDKLKSDGLCRQRILGQSGLHR
jgi:hypothetical protein